MGALNEENVDGIGATVFWREVWGRFDFGRDDCSVYDNAYNGSENHHGNWRLVDLLARELGYCPRGRDLPVHAQGQAHVKRQKVGDEISGVLSVPLISARRHWAVSRRRLME